MMSTQTPQRGSDARPPAEAAPRVAPSAPSPDGPFTDSAPRRTWLAAERTYLAWLRTGLGALGLAVAVGRLVPALIDASHIEFGLLGIGYGALGIFLLCMSAYRAQRVRAALAAQRDLPPDIWVMWVLTAASLVLAALTVVLIAVAV